MKHLPNMLLIALLVAANLMSRGAAQAQGVPEGVTPVQSTAVWQEEDVWWDGTPFTHFRVTVTFWNVGALGGGDYGNATYSKKCIDFPDKEWPCEDSTSAATFSGGPTGALTFSSGGDLPLIDASYFKVIFGDQPRQITLTDPNLFANWPATPTEEPEEEPETPAELVLVIPGSFFGGSEDRRIEVKNGVIDMTVPFRFRPTDDFVDAPIKGTYNPETDLLEATFVVTPKEEGADFLMEFDGTLKADLSKGNTADFMTMEGKLWQWTPGDEKGPPGDFYLRVFYNVEYPPGQEPAKVEKPRGEPVDSNFRFWLKSSYPSGAEANCFIKRAGSNELERISEQTQINVGDVIVNPPDGKNVVLALPSHLDEGVGLQPGTNFTITDQANLLSLGEFMYKQERDPESGINKTFDNYEMQLARLNVKLKGTTVVIKEDGETSSVKVIGGIAEVTDIVTGRVVEIGPGKMIAATIAGVGAVQDFDVAAENTRWNDVYQGLAAAAADALAAKATSTPVIYVILGAIAAIIVVGAAVFLIFTRKRKKAAGSPRSWRP